MATGSAEVWRPRVKFSLHTERNGEAAIPYLTWGAVTPLGVITGIHGDEKKSRGPTAHCLVNLAHTLRGFTFIDRGSPTAFALGSEVNGWGNNVNRHFLEFTTDPEVMCLMGILRRHAPYETIVTIHEDEGEYSVGNPVRDEATPFSLYHYGMPDPWLRLTELRTQVEALGVDLRNGIDVPTEEDPVLGYHFNDGYNYTNHRDIDGTVDIWAVNIGLAKRVYTVEIPMWLPKLTKTSLCQAVFDCVILTNPLLAFRIHSYLK